MVEPADNHYNDIIKLSKNYYTSYVYGFRETLQCVLQVRMLHVQGEESSLPPQILLRVPLRSTRLRRMPQGRHFWSLNSRHALLDGCVVLINKATQSTTQCSIIVVDQRVISTHIMVTSKKLG